MATALSQADFGSVRANDAFTREGPGEARGRQDNRPRLQRALTRVCRALWLQACAAKASMPVSLADKIH
ncbi:hypothetical protein ACCS96_16135, partial [Rhizobium ruizarguesonis]